MAGKKKYYVVWNGVEPGVYDSWNACKLQIEGYQNAKYKSFETMDEAVAAYRQGDEEYYREHPTQKKEVRFISSNDPKPVYPSIAVDAACNMVTKVMEYRCVDTVTKKEIFHRGPFPGASNNIGEFLAIVHALALLKQKGSNLPIYSDSMTAIAWVRNKKYKTVVLPTDKNAVVFDMLERAEKWLRENTFSNPIIKWNTPVWGEIPADFGRK